MKYVIHVISFVLILSLCACEPNRPETVAYFAQSSGIAICENAMIKNKRYGDYDYAKDPAYAVEIKASAKCLDGFSKRVGLIIKSDCDKGECHRFDERRNYIEIERHTSDRLYFVINFIS